MKSLVPLITSFGEPNPREEDLNYKVILFYEDKVVFTEADQAEYFQRDNAKIRLLRTVYYSDLQLDCGSDNNKICTLKEFLQNVPDLTIRKEVISKMNGLDYRRLCFVIPIVDQTSRPLDQSMIYICQHKPGAVRDLMLLRDKLSRLIEKQHLHLTLDQYNAMNSIPRKIANFYSVDQLKLKTVPTKAYLTIHTLTGYKDVNDFNSVSFELHLRMIDLNKKVQLVSDAINSNILEKKIYEDFTRDVKDRLSENTCIFIPLKQTKQGVILCYLDPKASDDQKTIACKNWIKKITIYTEKLQYVDDLFTLSTKASNENCDIESAEFKYIAKRLLNLGDFQDQLCKDLSISVQGYSGQYCMKDKTDDISQEISLLSDNNNQIQSTIQKCISSGKIKLDLNVVQQTKHRFLQLNN